MFFKKYLLVLILSFIAGAMIIIKFNYKNTNNVQLNVNNNLNKSIVKEININYPLKEKLPYFGENLDILEYKENLVLKVVIKNQDKELVSNEMINFFNINKIDINSHKFVFEN